MRRTGIPAFAVTLIAAAVATAACAPAAGGDDPMLPDPPPGFDPTSVGPRVARIVTGRVLASAPGPGGAPCPTSLGDATGPDGAPLAGALPLPWDAAAPPWSEWRSGEGALCGLDSLGRLVVALPADRRDAASTLAAARLPSQRFSDRELAWAYAALARTPNAEYTFHEALAAESGERDRWLELALRFGPDVVTRERLHVAETPTDLLHLAWRAGRDAPRVGRELLRRGERVDMTNVWPDRARGRPPEPRFLGLLVAAGDADARKVLLAQLADARNPDAAGTVLDLGLRDDAEMRAALVPAVRRGTPAALAAWLECGGTARELIEMQPGAPVLLDQGEFRGAAAREWMTLAAARTAQSRDEGLLWAARIAKDVADAERAAALGAFDGVAPSDDVGADALRLAIRARLGDAASAAALARIDWATVPRGEDHRTIAFLRLLATSRGPYATAALVRFLVMPELPLHDSGCGNRNDDEARRDAVESLSRRDSAEESAALGALDVLGPTAGRGMLGFLVTLRWRLGDAPDAATFLAAFPGDRGPELSALRRGAWGRYETVLRKELAARNDWQTLLALDGKVPDEVVERALDVVKDYANRKNAPFRGGDPLDVLVASRPGGALDAVRALLASAKRERPATWAAIGRLTPPEDLAALAREMIERTSATPPDRRPESWIAHGFLTALVARTR